MNIIKPKEAKKIRDDKSIDLNILQKMYINHIIKTSVNDDYIKFNRSNFIINPNKLIEVLESLGYDVFVGYNHIFVKC